MPDSNEPNLTWGPLPDVRAVLARVPAIRYRDVLAVPVDKLNELEAIVLLSYYLEDGFERVVVSRHNDQTFWFFCRKS